MLIQQRFWAGIADGSVTVAFRHWKRPTVRTGGTLRSPVGMLAIDDVRVVAAGSITEDEARAAGFKSRAALFAELEPHRIRGDLYRIRFHMGGPDPRIALRETATLTAEERVALTARLARMDAAAAGPWTATMLELIAANPGTRAADLAARVGRETAPFKLDVRKLKALGLTESLEVGYRLSARGRAYLEG